MFKYDDKITLSLINARDIDDNIVPFSLNLPFNEQEKIDYSILENVVAIDVVEYQEDDSRTKFPLRKVFSIYMGYCSTITALFTPYNKNEKSIKPNIKIDKITSPICYTVKDDCHIIFAQLNPGDILVSNIEELEQIINKLSEYMTSIYEDIHKIKTLSRIPLKNYRKKNKNAN